MDDRVWAQEMFGQTAAQSQADLHWRTGRRVAPCISSNVRY
jgi:hypothetical protein